MTWSRRIVWLIIVMTLLRIVLAVTVPLIDDEAYYWLWSRRLALGYLDQSPMIAYVIALTTLPGDGQFWLRLGPLLIGAATTYALYLLGRDLFDERAGFIAAVLYQIVPVLAGGALLATPDSPLFLAWTLALRFFWRALHGRPAGWVAAGAAMGLGLLSKLPMLLLGLGIGLFVLLRARTWLARREPYLAALLALALFLPVVYWNLTHDWAGIRPVPLLGRPADLPPGLPGIGQIILQQFAYVLLLFPAFAWALWAAWRRRADERFGFLFWTAAPVIAVFLLSVGIAGGGHGNWWGPAYLGLAVVLGALWNRTAQLLAVLSGVVAAVGLAMTVIPALPPPPGTADVYGWKEAAARVEHELSSAGSSAIIVADRYQVAAQLGYYTRDTVPATLLPHPDPASIWPRVEQFAGRDGITALDARWSPYVDWSRYAARVEELPPLTIRYHGRPVRTFRIFRLHGLRVESARVGK